MKKEHIKDIEVSKSSDKLALINFAIYNIGQMRKNLKSVQVNTEKFIALAAK